MVLRHLARFSRSATSAEVQALSFSAPYIFRRSFTNQSIADPRPPGNTSTVRTAHPKDPGPSSQISSDSLSPPPAVDSSTTPSPPSAVPTSTGVRFDSSSADTSSEFVPASNPPVLANPVNVPQSSSKLPTPQNTPGSQLYAHSPFNTYKFFSELEKTFATPTARGLMRASRALLLDRTGRVKREALSGKDLESQAYLFKAALSEMRTEMTMRRRNGSAGMRTATAALRREVDALDGRMKEDIDTLKHEIQMELDSRKSEAKNDLRQQDILYEELLSKSLVTLGELRTTMEEVRWGNMRNSVIALSSFLLVILVSMELLTARLKESKPPPPPPPEIIQPESEGLQKMDWVT